MSIWGEEGWAECNHNPGMAFQPQAHRQLVEHIVNLERVDEYKWRKERLFTT